MEFHHRGQEASYRVDRGGIAEFGKAVDKYQEHQQESRYLARFASIDLAARCIAFNSSKHVYGGSFYVMFKFV
eukprot:gnl/Chilomastix_caulleri/4322.p1 GENE.gnl/Chilomastix_caulleri/4322~~gnl/Chilomastix_caulleri/4322.p1  ORF type:complete len:73 (+),score=11.42 gnl/Chilomastix_caulleri/4322:100-318(+)